MASSEACGEALEDARTYRYAPLEGARYIRLVELFPGKGNALISCSLRHISLDSEPAFEALSYVWGDPKDVEYIHCDGCRLEITGNLGQALRALRSATDGPPRVLWIDAIAINQQDLQERSAQVQLMGTIYGLATSVPIWLGPADERTKEAYDLITRISTAFKKVSATPEYSEAITKGDKLSISDFNIPDPNTGGWPSLTELLQRPWFSRVWVLQEAILAAKVVVKCGNFTADLQSLENVLLSLYRTSEWHRNFLTWSPTYYQFEANLKSTMQLRRIRTEQQYVSLRMENLQLYNLVRNARHREATNPRDKIYSMLGLACDLHTHPFVPDYTLPVSRVYADFTRRYIQQTGSLDCLLDISSFEHRQYEDTIPSWVADWRIPGASPEVFLQRKKPFCATLTSTAMINLPTIENLEDPMLLMLRGFHLTNIVETTYGPGYMDMIQQYITEDVYSKTGETLDSLKLHSRLLTKDLYDNFLQDDVTGESEEKMMAHLEEPFVRPPHSELDAGRGKFTFSTINHRSSVFVSGDGYIGTSDGGIESGDEIWLLEGADRPYALRKNESGMYIIVEEAFVHGVMYGEVWPTAEKHLQDVVLA